MRQYRTSGTVQGVPSDRRSYCETGQTRINSSSPSPSPADLAEHVKDLGIEQSRVHYGPVAVGMMH